MLNAADLEAAAALPYLEGTRLYAGADEYLGGYKRVALKTELCTVVQGSHKLSYRRSVSKIASPFGLAIHVTS
ncbi:hypothetical protein [uncultured Tateyamaria sp.]|uniref:hypothetical protein n=1 Tax=uncultured Tateyamaria sp. TaxID=455651 RepID=UPI0026170A3D|nr:hypothetical protein [uncultured Tateyamaria sp.]